MHKTLERVPVEGGELTLARWANPSARPVLLVHGITGSHMVWPLVVQALAGEYDLYAPDLRGRGGSRSLPGPYGLSRHCRDLTAVLAHYAIAEVDIVGHSLGAYIALELAATAPERVARLVLVDGGIGLPLPEGASAEAVIESLLGPAIERLGMRFESRAAYQDFWRRHPAFQDVGDWQALMADFCDYDLVGEPPALRSSVCAEAVREDGAGPLAPAMRTRIDEVRQPRLLLTAPRGLQDQPEPLMPPELVRDKLASNPGLAHSEIPECNHYTIVMDAAPAAATAAHIDRFLELA